MAVHATAVGPPHAAPSVHGRKDCLLKPHRPCAVLQAQAPYCTQPDAGDVDMCGVVYVRMHNQRRWGWRGVLLETWSRGRCGRLLRTRKRRAAEGGCCVHGPFEGQLYGDRGGTLAVTCNAAHHELQNAVQGQRSTRNTNL